MCGIVGIFNLDKEDIKNQSLYDMCRTIEHRGPDDRGTYFRQNFSMGMQRLSIIDIDNGSQPIYNKQKTVWTVFNGEIYNYKELRKKLVAKNYEFNSNTDTEVIVHLYEEYGENFVTLLNGMFSIALWDVDKETLFLYRDRMGEKPLHYHYDNKKLFFGSEIKSILINKNISNEIDYYALSLYFSLGYIPAPYTIYKDIKKLLPAHYIKINTHSFKIKEYWSLNINDQLELKPEAYYAEKIIELLTDSIRLRLISDVPLGSFLSGGIDSSLIVAIMKSELGISPKTFSIGFDEKSHSELDKAKIISDLYKTEHNTFIVKKEEIENTEFLFDHLDEPFADSSIIPTYLLSKMTREHVKVSLSGDGGDELFGGYTRYLSLRNNYPLLPRKMANFTSGIMPDSIPGKNYLLGLSMEADEYYTMGINRFRNKKLFTKEFFSKMSDDKILNFINSKMDNKNNRNNFHKYLHYDALTYLPDDILTKLDRSSMAVSLEARVPFLDHRLVEFAFTIPLDLKIKNGRTKHILKMAAENYLPKKIINAPKKGFSLPIDIWFKKSLSAKLNDTFNQKKIISQGVFNNDYIQFLIKEHSSEKRNHKSLIWKMYVFQTWYDNNYIKI
jgi:asparagine synthase (glutamine-hydrolysing)